MSSIQIAGVLLIVGTLSFWLGATMPTWRVYMASDPEKRVQLISDMRRYWILSHVLFLAGVVIIAAGLGVFTTTVEAADARAVAIAGLIAIILATLVWAYIVIAFRLSMSPQEYVHTTAGAWTGPAYILLTLGALILYGVVLLEGDFPNWLGPVTIGLNSLLFISFVIQKDSIPAVLYISTLIIGVALLS